MTFLALHSDFCGLPGSLLSLRLAVPQIQETIERKTILDKKGHYENPIRALNTTSLKCCFSSTDAIDGHIHMKVQGYLM